MNFSYITFTAALYFALVSCSNSSTSSTPSSKIKLKENATGKVVQVDILDKDELRRQGINPEDKQFEKAIVDTTFAQKKNWYRMNEDHKDYKAYSEKTVAELKTLLSSANEENTTLIIEVLSHKGATAVSVLIDKLSDTRIAKFRGDNKIYWYEEKNKPPQELEIRLYAAMQLEKLADIRPYGVVFDFHIIRTQEGPIEVLYASKGSYAVNKEDVCQNWLKWWKNHGGDFR